MNGKQPIRRYKRRASGGTTAVIVLLIIVVIFAFVCLILAITGKLDPLIDQIFDGPQVTETADPSEQTDPSTDPSTESDPSQTEPESNEVTDDSVTDPAESGDDDPAAGSWLNLDKTATASGTLILLDNDHPYSFPLIPDLIDLYTYRHSMGSAKYYSLKDSSLELNEEAAQMLNEMLVAFATENERYDIMVQGAYRSYDYQQSLYDRNGGVNAFKGGCSDYHTGDAVYFKLINEDGTTQELSRDKESYDWFKQNAYKYGYIMRYPTEKKAYTGTITDGEGHYRYVGVAHATAMHERNLCLEEYLTFVRDFTYQGNHLQVTTEDGAYEIYSVVLSETGVTKVPIPAGSYTLSGDNCGAVIFSVRTGE